MVRIAFVFIVILITSCSSSDEPIDTSLPSCIEEILANPELSEDIKTIQVQRLDNESHYWLNNDIRFVDGIEYIINNQCDTVCGLGGFVPPPCSSDYDNDSWEVIWSL